MLDLNLSRPRPPVIDHHYYLASLNPLAASFPAPPDYLDPIARQATSRSLLILILLLIAIRSPASVAAPPHSLHFSHHPGHGQRCPRRFGTPIVFLAEAAHAGVLFFFKDEHRMNDRNVVMNLDLCQRVRHAPANMLRVTGLALKNDAKANDGGKG